MAKLKLLQSKLVAIKLNKADKASVAGFESAFDFQAFIYGIVESDNLIKIINESKPYTCPRKFKILTPEDSNVGQTFDIRTANMFEIKSIYCLLKSDKNNAVPVTLAQLESLMSDEHTHIAGQIILIGE